MQSFEPLPSNPRFIDLTGQSFERLTVLGYVGKRSGKTYWLCRCDCGKETNAPGSHLRNRSYKSCGCFGREALTRAITKHGYRHKSIYNIWKGMRQRCNPLNALTYPAYAGRGISVCDRWQNSFEAFLADMGEPPSHDHSIERINNNGNYEPSNCKWVTSMEQGQNKRNNILLTFQGKTQTLTAWSREMHINRTSLRTRLFRLGWSVEKAISTPVRKMSKTYIQSEKV